MAAPTLSTIPYSITSDISGQYASVLSADTTVPQTRAIYVGGAGNLTVTMAGSGATCLLTAVPAGSFLPLAITSYTSSGTTATAIVGIW